VAKRKHTRYDDKFRASALLILEAAGYPHKKGALTQASKTTGVPLTTLKGWAKHKENPPPTEIRNEKEFELISWIQNEIKAVAGRVEETRQDASYRELMVSLGILIDKNQILTGKPTEISNIKIDGLERAANAIWNDEPDSGD
jgi:hypothetical protein